MNGLLFLIKGICSEFGIYLGQNLFNALDFYKKGAKLNNYLCYLRLFQIYNNEYSKFFVEQNINLAFIYLIKCLSYFFLYFNDSVRDGNSLDQFNFYPQIKKLLEYFKNIDKSDYIKVIKSYPDKLIDVKFQKYIFLLFTNSLNNKETILKLDNLAKNSNNSIIKSSLLNLFHFSTFSFLSNNLNKTLNCSLEHCRFYLSQIKEMYFFSNYISISNIIFNHFGEVNHYLYTYYKILKQIKVHNNLQIFIDLENYCMKNFEYNFNCKHQMFENIPIRLHSAKQYIIQFIFNKDYLNGKLKTQEILNDPFINQEINRSRVFLYLLGKIEEFLNFPHSAKIYYEKSLNIYLDDDNLFPIYMIAKLERRLGLSKSITNNFLNIAKEFLKSRESHLCQFYPYFIKCLRKAKKFRKKEKKITSFHKILFDKLDSNIYFVNEHILSHFEFMDLKYKVFFYSYFVDNFILGYNYIYLNQNNIENQNSVKFHIYVKKFNNNLSNFIKTKSMSLPLKINLIISIAESIMKLHNDYIIHGIIKPEYILFDEENKKPSSIFINLFYLSNTCHFERLLLEESKFGDIRYIHKDLVISRNLMIEYDSYSLGIIMYEILSGKKAYEGFNNDCLLSFNYKEFFEFHTNELTYSLKLSLILKSKILELLTNSKYRLRNLIEELKLLEF